MEKCTKAGYNELIVKGKCLNGQNYFLNGRIQNMRMTKKVTAMALASMMALSLAGCGAFRQNGRAFSRLSRAGIASGTG